MSEQVPDGAGIVILLAVVFVITLGYWDWFMSERQLRRCLRETEREFEELEQGGALGALYWKAHNALDVWHMLKGADSSSNIGTIRGNLERFGLKAPRSEDVEMKDFLRAWFRELTDTWLGLSGESYVSGESDDPWANEQKGRQLKEDLEGFMEACRTASGDLRMFDEILSQR